MSEITEVIESEILRSMINGDKMTNDLSWCSEHSTDIITKSA